MSDIIILIAVCVGVVCITAALLFAQDEDL